MQAIRFLTVALVLIFAASSVAAYHETSVVPYGDYGYEHTRSRTAEQVMVRESESAHSSSDYGGYRHYYNTNKYDYGRSREFSFSRTSDYENERHYANYGYPSGAYSRRYSSYSYPYADVGTDYGVDYRPYADYYDVSYTSPYNDPYQYSRVGNYAYRSRYLPYGY